MNLKLKHKRLYTLLAMICLVLSLAVVLTACGDKNKGDGPKEPEYTEGPECGVYYYDVADGEILLTLSGENKFTLAGPGVNKTGTYTIDEEGNIVLDYIRDEDGTENAKLTGNTVTVQKGDVTMPFLKKINFTVTFDVNGGTTVVPATVTNGKTVIKPNDPTKAGYAFLGWYADSALKTVFDFASTTVTENVTIYAKWVQDQVGVGKHTISFDLGYADAPKYENITTIAGLAYNVPTPTRQGYTFGGWWISMYDDADKLSYEYTETTEFEADTTLYAVWTQTQTGKLPAPMASVNKNTIKWNAVSGATSYTVVITDAAGNKVLNESDIGTTSINFNFDEKDAGNYIVTVTANNASGSSDATVRYVANKTLAMVTQFQVIDGILIYNAVKNATSYSITVDCGNPAHNHTNFDNGASTSFSLINCPMQAGGIKITVTAKANGYASSVSKTYVYNRVLSAIEAVVYNAQADAFVWNAVPAATSYVVTVTVGNNTYTIDNGLNTAFSVANYTGDIKVSVKPVNAGYNSPAATEATCKKVTPAVPTGLTVNGMVVTWNAAAGAEKYEIKIGDTKKEVTGTSYTISASTLTAGQTYAISVKSIKGTESSAYTAPVSFGYKVMNTALTYKNNTVYWTPVIGVSNYEIKVNGTVVKEVSGVNSAKVTLTREGVNTIEVRYTDVAGSAWAKVDVVAYSVSYYPRNNNNSFVTAYYAIGDTMTHPRDLTYDGYDFVDWYSSPSGAAGNGKLYADGETFNEHGSIALFAEWTPKTYKVTVSIDASYGVSNITDKTEYSATYTKDFTMAVPTIQANETLMFAGWYTLPGGTGTQLTDENGKSVAPYPLTKDTVAYPYFRVILSYVEQPDGTYAVKAGPDFNSAKNVTIPVSYQNKKVTTILENGFASKRSLTKISIPDTIRLIGVGAFTGCSALEYIDIYNAGATEIIYSSDNGALVHYDGESVYLEVVPRNMTGTYTMSDDIQYISSRAFQSSQLDKVVIGKGVVNIAKYAFYICSHIEIFEFAEGAEQSVTIESEAFHQCNGVKELKLPKAFSTAEDSLTQFLDHFKKLSTIKVEAGGNYKAIENDTLLANAGGTELIYVPLATPGDFTVPTGISSIGDNVLYGRTLITGITIPHFVTSIGSQAFAGCTAVKTVTFNGNRMSNLTIGSQAFAGLTSLTTVTFKANTVEEAGSIEIGEGAFLASSAGTVLSHLVFEDGVKITSIGKSAFANQTKLNPFTVGNGTVITTIGDYAFSNNSAIVRLTIPAGVTSIGANAFANCFNLSEVTIAEGDVAISLGENAFQNCANLRKITLSSKVSNFTGSVVTGCFGLKEVKITEGKTNPNLYTESGVLYNSAKTTLLFYPKALILENNGKVENLISTLTTIDASVFEANTDIVSIKIPASVNKIGNRAFYGCTALTSVKFDTTGTAATSLELGTNVFQNCTALTYGANGIELPAYTTKIGNYAFSGCAAIANLTIPASVTSIGNYAFSGCKLITSLDIPANVTTVGNGAFKGTGIISLTIPTNVTKVGDGAFQDCTSLTTVIVTPHDTKTLAIGGTTSQTATSGVGAFQGCTALTSVDFGNRVNTIGNNTFNGCTAENISINIGNKVTKIGAQAFYGVKLTTITIPTTVTNIYTGAFNGGVDENGAPAGTFTSINFAMGNTTTKLSLYASVFANQPNITKITLPARTNAIYAKTSTGSTTKLETFDTATLFAGMTNLASIEVEVIDGYKAKFSSKEGVLYENNTTSGNPVTLLYCPVKNTGTNGTVTVPKTVTYVHRGAFYDVTGITTVNFEEYASTDANYTKQLLNIGNNTSAYSAAKDAELVSSVFGGSATNSITTINLPSHLNILGTYAISNTANTITVNFSNSTKISVCPYAFYKANFTSINIPNVASIGKGAFSNCAAATSISFTTTEALVKIPANLFEKCVSLSSYTIPASITALDSSVFTGCSGLTSVSFATGSKLKTIGSSVFKGTGLTSIDLSGCADLESIGQSAFELCTSLESVNLTGLEKLATISAYAFRHCTALESFTLPASVETLGSHVFTNCTDLETITLYGNFNYDMFKNNKFVGCSKLAAVNFVGNTYFISENGAIYDPEKTIIYRFLEGATVTGYTIPTSVTAIDDYAFTFYSGTSITLHEGIATIGNSAFVFNKLTTINIPASVTSIGDAAFGASNDTATMIGVDGKPYRNTYVSQLATVTFATGSQLTSIGKYAFYYAEALTSISIPDSVETIGRNAFDNCKSLPSIIIPAALKLIDRDTFSGCTSLTSITLQEGLETIGSGAFSFISTTVIEEDDKGTLSVTIPASVTVIGGGAFDYNALLGNITFANNSKLTQIGGIVASSGNDTGASSDYTFRGTEIKNITIPSLVSSIGTNTFYTPTSSVSKLETVTFTGSALKSIPNQFFRSNVNLESVTLPEGLETIGNSAFSNAGDFAEKAKFTSITIPASVTSIGTSAFLNCTALTDVTFAEGSQVTEISEQAFKNTSALARILLPAELTTIGVSAFENSGIANIDLPDSLETIGDSAFKNCDNIISVEFYVNVQSIGAYAFYDCDKLTTAVPAPGLTKIGDLAFANCKQLTRAYIPYTVYEIGGNPYAGCTKANIELDPMNEFYKFDENGILFDAEMTVLVAYPGSITDAELVIPDGVNTIAPGAFAGAAMTTVVFPARFGAIPESAFYGCTNLTTLVIQDGITEIGDSAFEGCVNLNNVTIPNTVNYVGNYAFAGCTSMSNVSFEDKEGADYYTLGTHIFYGCTALTKVVLPNAWEITKEDAIACGLNDGRQNLTNPNNVQPEILQGNIPSYMFANTGITTADLPARVTMLRTKGVFMNCENLSAVNFGVSKLSHAASALGADYFTGTALPTDFKPPYGTSASGPSIKV